jgi:NADH-quinone oxidoreductase subunit L
MLELQSFQVLSTVNCGWLWMIAGAPLLGALLNGLLSLRPSTAGSGRWARAVALAASGFSFFLAFLAFLDFKNLPDNTVLFQNLLDWMDVSHLRFTLGLQLDDLSLALALFITWISGWIHLYAAGSLKPDSGAGLSRYLACLNLLLFFMLVLVMADGFLLLFVGWEGVGLCSIFLIGFGGAEGPAGRAARKALAIHRVADGAFLTGLVLVVALTGTANFNDLEGLRQDFHEGEATLLCLCFLLAAVGKSAQFPLSTWLPDSTLGPVPGAALLYAVTLGVTGVYLIARLHFLFVLAPWATTVMALLGTATALGGVFLSAVQTQLKKILAYWTLSQIGLMFLGLGVSAYTAGLFHLITFGFFLPVLFLAAGSVIDALKGEQDIRKMGGLLKQMPLTSLAFLLAWLAASGLAPFSSFFSANEILWRALATPNPLIPWLPPVLYGAGLLTAGLTAYSLTRLAALAFFGPEKKHKDRDTREPFHDSPLIMTVPLLILAVISLGIGWIGLPEAIGGGAHLDHFLDSTFRLSTLESNGLAGNWQPILMLVFLGVVLSGVGVGWVVYSLKPRWSLGVLRQMDQAGKAEASWFGLDFFYEKVLTGWIRAGADWVCRRLIDEILLESLVSLLGRGAAGWTRTLKKSHMGWAQFYLLYVLTGAGLLIYFAFH